MFTKGKSPDRPEDAKPPSPSILAPDLKIIGNITCKGEVQVDGAVEGDIRSDKLLIGPAADIKGEVIAESVVIHGTVKGQIQARVVRLAKTARVTGDVLHEELAIDKGAFLEGHCKRVKPAAEALKRPVTEFKAAGPMTPIASPNAPAGKLIGS